MGYDILVDPLCFILIMLFHRCISTKYMIAPVMELHNSSMHLSPSFCLTSTTNAVDIVIVFCDGLLHTMVPIICDV